MVSKVFKGYFDLLEAERKKSNENKMIYEKQSSKSGSIKEIFSSELLFEREQAKATEEFRLKKQKESEPDLHNVVFGINNPYFKGNEALTTEQQVQLVKDAYNTPKGTITELRQDFQTFTAGFVAMAAAAGAVGQPQGVIAGKAAAGVTAGIAGGLALYEAGYDNIHAFVDKGIHELQNFINKLNGAKTTSKSLKEIRAFNKEVAKQEQEIKKLLKKLEQDRLKLEKANVEPKEEEKSDFDVVAGVINAIDEFKETAKKYVSFDKPLPALFDESYHEQTAKDPYITNVPEPVPIEEETEGLETPVVKEEVEQELKPEPVKKVRKPRKPKEDKKEK